MQAATQQTDIGLETEMELVKRHERLIRYVALPFARRGIMVEDLMQEGRIALLHAARQWRASEGVRLWTYARKFVLGAMFRFVTSETAEPSGGEDSLESVEALGPTPEDAFDAGECAALASRELSFLSDVERRVLRLRFAAELDVRTVAAELELSKSDVDRIYHGAIAKLRERVGAAL